MESKPAVTMPTVTTLTATTPTLTTPTESKPAVTTPTESKLIVAKLAKTSTTPMISKGNNTSQQV